MLAQHTDESFRADHVRFRNAGGAVVQVLMRSDFFATEAFFCDHGRHPFLEQRQGFGARGSRRAAHRIVAQSRATQHHHRAGRHVIRKKPDPPWARLFRARDHHPAPPLRWLIDSQSGGRASGLIDNRYGEQEFLVDHRCPRIVKVSANDG
jgi:hypothetical protein